MINLSNWTIKSKLFLMLTVPLLAVLFFSISGIMERLDLTDEMESLQSLSVIAVKSSNLVHETQKERGATGGFLGSEGKKFKEELSSQRKDTNDKINELRKILKNMDISSYGTGFNIKLNKALRELDGISKKRKLVDSMSISGNDAIAYYTQLNSSFLNVISDMIFISNKGSITRKVTAYVNFLQGKERAGIERAVMSNTFAADIFNPGMFNKFSKLVTQQETYSSMFLSLAEKDEISFFKSKMNSNIVKETEKMRSIAYNKAAEGKFEIDPIYWFQTQTKKINLLKEAEDILSKNLNNKADALKKEAYRALQIYIIITVAAIAIALLMSFLFSRSIIGPLTDAYDAMADIAEGEGDLTRRLDDSGKDEISRIGSGFNKFVGKISDLIAQILTSTENLAQSVDEITKGNQDLSQRTSEQASSLEEIASTIEEANATTKQNAANADEAKKFTEEATFKVKDGSAIVNEAVLAINEVNESSKKISEIISVINEIAFQTNLLALNAAVEAARAGEQGRGFAVVAGEVRNLAQRAGNAAKEIESLITNSVEKVGKGTDMVNKSGDALKLIGEVVDKSAQLISEIAVASDEQRQGIEQINDAVLGMDTMTQHNASLVEQTASASEEMSDRSRELLALANNFKISTG
ncbi:MAG: HAMP domain-containing protein [bacterium]|nr:HAMP domain-containing protein [bacterium]